jgi:uncharacterized protein (TIGR03083 family)
MHQLGFDRYHAELDAETARLAALSHGADPALPVPTCPTWTLGELVRHVGCGDLWAAEIVERRATGPVPNVDAGLPDGADARSAWLTGAARRLADAVRDRGPRQPVWSWGADRTAGFWLAKMVHDTLVHRLDAELALGHAGEVAIDLAADGVTDLLMSIAVLSPPDSADPVFAGLRGAGETLHFHATDPGLGEAGEWRVRRTQAGVEWQPGHGKADVAVRGPARELLLVLNRRTAPEQAAGLEVFGDRELFYHWLAHSAFQ